MQTKSDNALPTISRAETVNNSEFWKVLKPFKEIEETDFLSYKWQAKHTVFGLQAIKNFLQSITCDYAEFWLDDTDIFPILLIVCLRGETAQFSNGSHKLLMSPQWNFELNR